MIPEPERVGGHMHWVGSLGRAGRCPPQMVWVGHGGGGPWQRELAAGAGWTLWEWQGDGKNVNRLWEG